MTEKEMIEIKHGSENMADLLNQEQTELKTAMIEELGNTLYCKQDKFDLSNPFEVAKAVIEEGCIKIPEGAVVLTREEMENLYTEEEYDKAYEQAEATILGNIADGGTSCHWCIKKHEEKARKETAREILTDLWKERNAIGQLMIFEEHLIELAKQFGVEVEE